MIPIFTLHAIISIEKSSKAKVNSIFAYGDKILVGLSTGSLRVYTRIDDSPEDLGSRQDGDRSHGAESVASLRTELISEHTHFSKRAVEQLALIKEADTLISLSDASVRLHDLHSCTLVQQLTASRGASQIAQTTVSSSDPESEVQVIISRLAVAVKRRILFWTWRDSQLDAEPFEISLESSVRSITWSHGLSLVCGLNSGFVLLDSETREIRDIIQSRPNADGRGDGESERFGAHGATMSYMGMSGWTPPTMATKLGRNEVLLVRDVGSFFINTAGNAIGKRPIPWTVAPDTIAYSYPYLLSAFMGKGTLEVRNPDTLTTLQTLSLPSIRLLHIPPSTLSLTHAAKGCYLAADKAVWQLTAASYDEQVASLCKDKRWDEALSLLASLEDALVSEKHAVVQHVEIEKAIELFANEEYKRAFQLFTTTPAPPEIVIKLFPPEISGEGMESVEATAEQKAVGSSKDYNVAIHELCNFLVDARFKLHNSVGFQQILRTNSTGTSTDEMEAMERRNDSPAITWDRNGKDVPSELQALRSTATLIDTTLARAWMIIQPSMATVLFRRNNFCDPQIVTIKLTATNQYKELIDFYEGKGIHRPALELLRDLGDRVEPDPRAPDLHGSKRTIKYLRALREDAIDLILEFVPWVLREDPMSAMSVFLTDSSNAESLPRERVTQFLHQFDPRLELLYLDHLINKLHDTTPSRHEQYLGLLLDPAVRRFGNNNEHQSWNSKLMEFLRTGLFSSRRALDLLTSDEREVQEARAIVLGRMHQHRKVLELYVFELGDYRKAEMYANSVEHERPAGGNPTGVFAASKTGFAHPIHRILLELYLSPPTSQSPNIKQALNLLSRHGARLPYTEIMSVLPTDLELTTLSSYFTTLLRVTNSAAATASIGASLRKVNLIDVEAKLHMGKGSHGEQLSVRHRSLKVGIDEDRTCGICQKRLGPSVISVLPSQKVVHYGCSRRQG